MRPSGKKMPTAARFLTTFLRVIIVVMQLYRVPMPKEKNSKAHFLRSVVLLLSAILVFQASKAFATDLIYPGIQPKTGAGAGQTISRGSSALFYNPANLIFSKRIEPYLDVSFAQVNYTYTHTNTEQYDPTVVNVSVPPVTAGMGLRFTPRFAFGFAFMPTATGTVQTIENVPIRIQGDYVPMTIENKQSGLKIAAGAAFRFGHPLTLGAGIIHTRETNIILITPQERTIPLIDLQNGGAWNQFTLGVRSEILDRRLVLALSYKTAALKTYSGDILVTVDEEDDTGDYEPFEGVGYLPGAIGFGAETRFGIFGVFFDYVMELWSAGRATTKRGYPSDPEATDLIDTNNITLGTKIWVGKKHMLTGAFSMQGANIGDGTEFQAQTDASATADGSDDRLSGVSFGSLDAIARTIFAGGYRYKLTGHGYFQTGVHYASGKRVVPEGFDGEGTYSLSVLMVSGGLAFGF
jgi:hypothetical protein